MSDHGETAACIIEGDEARIAFLCEHIHAHIASADRLRWLFERHEPDVIAEFFLKGDRFGRGDVGWEVGGRHVLSIALVYTIYMNFEQRPLDLAEEKPVEPIRSPEQSPETHPTKMPAGKLTGWLRKTVALSGIIGLGYLGGTQESRASDATDGSMSKTNIFEVVHEDAESTWGIEYVPKRHDGRDIFAERYVKIDTKTGATDVIGEYDTVTAAAEGISKMGNVPPEVKALAERDAGVVQTERDFQASGFTEPVGHPTGHTRMELRTFDGYGVHAKNSVEVDEEGKPVHLADSDVVH